MRIVKRNEFLKWLEAIQQWFNASVGYDDEGDGVYVRRLVPRYCCMTKEGAHEEEL